MGAGSTKHERNLRTINRDVSSMRASIRSSRRIKDDSRNAIVEVLIKQTGEVSNLKGKVKQKKVEETLKLISDTTSELLSRDVEDQDLDMGSVETNSFIQVPVTKGKADMEKAILQQQAMLQQQTKPRPKNFATTSNTTRKALPTINEIEVKLKSLRPLIATSVQNQDKKQLRVHKETIKVLATDLELIPVEAGTPLEERKGKLESKLSLCYQKIEKAFREISRMNNIEYLTMAQKKDKAWKELAIIEQDLYVMQKKVETELTKDNFENLHSLREELSKFSPRNNSIDAVEEQIRLKKLQLSERIQNISRYLEEGVHRRNTRSALLQASVDTHLFDTSTDCEGKLLQMKEFVDKLQVEDTDVQTLKRNLLKYIETTLNSFRLKEEELKKQEPVILRAKGQEPKENLNKVTTVNSFVNHWKGLQSNINIKSYSNEDLTKLDHLLVDLQESVAEKRKSIGAIMVSSRSKRNTLEKGAAQNQYLRNKKTVDEIDLPPIKTTVRVTELPPPQVKNVNPGYKDKSTDYLEAVTEIRNIKVKFDFIKEKLPQYKDKEEMKNKIQSYVNKLNKYTYHPHPNISNSAKSILQEFDNILKTPVVKRNSRRYSAIEGSLEGIAEISSFVDDLSKQLGSSKDVNSYNGIKQGLLNSQKHLEGIVVPQQYTMIRQTKEETLKLIHDCLNQLEDNEESGSMVKKYKAELAELKDKVNRFTGGYRNVLYNKIELNLRNLLVNVPDKIKSKKIANEIVKDVEKHLKILEQRATKVQVFNFASTANGSNRSSWKKSSMAKQEFFQTPANASVEVMHYNFPEKNSKPSVEEVSQLEASDSRGSQENLPNDWSAGETEAVQQFPDTKTNIPETKTSFPETKTNIPEMEISRIEEEVKKIQVKVQKFVGLESSQKYFDIDTSLIKFTLDLDKFNLTKDDALYERKLQLLQNINTCGQILDDRAEETFRVTKVEKEIIEIGFHLNQSLEGISYEELDDWDEQLIALQLRLGKLTVNDDLKQRKGTCVNQIAQFIKKLQVHKESYFGGSEGTIV